MLCWIRLLRSLSQTSKGLDASLHQPPRLLTERSGSCQWMLDPGGSAEKLNGTGAVPQKRGRPPVAMARDGSFAILRAGGAQVRMRCADRFA